MFAALLPYKKRQRLAPSHQIDQGKVLPGFRGFVSLRREVKVNEFHTERCNLADVNDVSEAKQYGKFN